MRVWWVVQHTVINTLAISVNVWSLQKAALSLRKCVRVPWLGVCDWRAWRGGGEIHAGVKPVSRAK